MSEVTLIGRPKLSQPGRDKRQSDARWLVTFADLAAVMVAFFVLLFSMAEVDSDKWEGATVAFDRQFRISDAKVTPRPVEATNITQRVEEEALDLRYFEQVVVDQIRANPALADVRTLVEPDRFVFDFPGELVFASGRVGIDRAGRESLFVIGGLFSTIENQTAVVSHAGSDPAADSGSGTDWELSLARAARTARAMHRAGYAGPIEIQGRSGSRFRTAAEETVAQAPTGLPDARRIEIIVLTETGDGE